jgi:hypothetical protein
MPTEIPWDKRIDCEDLFIVEGLTYEQVADKTGVGLSTLKRWGVEGDWTDRRRELREAQSRIKQKRPLLRLGLIEKAMEKYDPMQTFAFKGIEELELKRASLGPQEALGQVSAPEIEFKSNEEAFSGLQDAIRMKIGRMAAGVDELNLKTITDLNKAVDVLNEMKRKCSTKDKHHGNASISDISDETKKAIRGVYGLL